MITFKVSDLKNMNTELKAFADFLRTKDLDDENIFESKLVSCELITNVIRHGGETAEFCGELLPDKIVITVTAEGQEGFNLFTGLPDVYAESGRGLFIVRSICLGDIERCENGGLRVYIKRRK